MIDESASRPPAVPDGEAIIADPLVVQALNDATGTIAYQHLWNMLDRGYDLTAFQEHALTQFLISRGSPVLGVDLLDRNERNKGKGRELRRLNEVALKTWLNSLRRKS